MEQCVTTALAKGHQVAKFMTQYIGNIRISKRNFFLIATQNCSYALIIKCTHAFLRFSHFKYRIRHNLYILFHRL